MNDNPMIKIQYQTIPVLRNWLGSIPIFGKGSHLRSVFKAMLSPGVKAVAEKQDELQNKYVSKDENGNLVKETNKEGNEVFSFNNDKDKEKYISEMNEFLSKECEVEAKNEEQSEAMEFVARMVSGLGKPYLHLDDSYDDKDFRDYINEPEKSLSVSQDGADHHYLWYESFKDIINSLEESDAKKKEENRKSE